MRTFSLIVALAACLPTICFAQPAPSPKDDPAVTSALLRLKACVEGKAVKLDDGKSDALTIGKVATEACIEHIDEVSRLMAAWNGQGDLMYQQFRAEFLNRVPLKAAATVLRHRARH